MSRNVALNRTFDAISHLGDPEPPWAVLLHGMQQLVGGDSATLIQLDGGGELLNFQQHGVSATTERAYVEHFFAHDIVTPQTLGARREAGSTRVSCSPPRCCLRRRSMLTSCAPTACGSC